MPSHKPFLKIFPFVLAASHASAELVALDNDQLQSVRAQSGLTIDIETQTTLGEFKYVDEGALFIRDVRFEGINGGYVDNLRARVDVAGPNERLWRGFSDYAFYAELGYLDTAETDVAWALNKYKDTGTGEIGEEFNDGDLLIHVTATDYGLDWLSPASDGDPVNNLETMKNAIDFKITEGAFGIQSSDGLVETILTDRLSVEAYLGYLDIIVRNAGNGFSQTDERGEPMGVRIADSHIYIDAKFRVEDLDIDNTNNVRNAYIPQAAKNPYLTIRDMRIHNERGLDTLGSFGFASVEQKIAAVTDIIPSDSALMSVAGNNAADIANYGIDGISFYDINVRWDWDLPHIQFGETDTSIGQVHFTDFLIGGTNLTITAH